MWGLSSLTTEQTLVSCIEKQILNNWTTRGVLNLHFKKKIIYFNWRIITLQYCDGLCCTLTLISHRHTCDPSLLNSPPPPSLPQPSLRAPTLGHTSNSHWLSVLHMIMYTFQCYSLKSPILSSHCVQKTVLYVCLLCCPAHRTLGTIFLDSLLFCHPVMSNSLRPHGLQHARLPCLPQSPKVCPSLCSLHWWCLIPYICINIWYLSFSFWLISICIIGSRFIYLLRTAQSTLLRTTLHCLLL